MPGIVQKKLVSRYLKPAVSNLQRHLLQQLVTFARRMVRKEKDSEIAQRIISELQTLAVIIMPIRGLSLVQARPRGLESRRFVVLIARYRRLTNDGNVQTRSVRQSREMFFYPLLQSPVNPFLGHDLTFRLMCCCTIFLPPFCQVKQGAHQGLAVLSEVEVSLKFVLFQFLYLSTLHLKTRQLGNSKEASTETTAL